MHTLTVIARPNGSGKSTLTASIQFEGAANLIDPDAIARLLDSVQPARKEIPAAREAILQCNAFLTLGKWSNEDLAPSQSRAKTTRGVGRTQPCVGEVCLVRHLLNCY